MSASDMEARRLLDAASKMREGGATLEQKRRRAEVDARNARIQAVGPRPVDGVTFGSGKVPKS